MSAAAAAAPDGAGGARPPGVLWIVFTTIFIDFTSFSVLIPVLPLFAARIDASEVEVGLLLTVYALAQLLFLPAWGWLSDRFGRRPVLLIALLGTTLSYVVLAFAESMTAIYWARAFGGFCGASISTAQAIVTDVVPPERRARGMGLIGAAFGAAFVVGPILGGTLAEVDERLPFYAIAALAGINFLTAWLRLPESRPPLERPELRSLGLALVPTPLRLVTAARRRPRIGLFLYLFFHTTTAFAALEAMFALYLARRFGLGERDAGLIFAWIGVFIAITQGYLVGRLVRRFSESSLVLFGLAATALALTAVSVVPAYGWFFALGPLLAIGNGIAVPTFTSLYSKACEAQQAGELLGQGQSMTTTGRIVGPLLAGLAMQHLRLDAPFLLGGALMLVAFLIVAARRRMLAAAPG